MSDTNAKEKCFIVAFGAEHKTGIYCSEIAKKIYNILSPSAPNVWICPPNTKAIPTNIPNVFFVKGDTSETELSIFYREKIEIALSDCSKEYIRENVSLYIKEVSDDKNAMQF